MNINQAWHSIGSSVAAGIITYFILEWVDNDWSTYWKVGCIALVGVVAFVLAFMTGRSRKSDPSTDKRRVKVGTNIDSNEGVEVADVAVSEPFDANIDIGTNIDAEKKVKISGIRIGPKE